MGDEGADEIVPSFKFPHVEIRGRAPRMCRGIDSPAAISVIMESRRTHTINYVYYRTTHGM
jgi:hypothetical protein